MHLTCHAKWLLQVATQGREKCNDRFLTNCPSMRDSARRQAIQPINTQSPPTESHGEKPKNTPTQSQPATQFNTRCLQLGERALELSRRRDQQSPRGTCCHRPVNHNTTQAQSATTVSRRGTGRARKGEHTHLARRDAHELVLLELLQTQAGAAGGHQRLALHLRMAPQVTAL